MSTSSPDRRSLEVSFDALPVGGAYLDADGTVRRINRRLEVQLGAQRADVVGAPAPAVLGTDPGGRALAVIAAGLRGEAATAEVHWPAPDGRSHSVLLRALPDLDDQGALRGVVLTAEDLRGVAALRERDRELEAVQRVARIGGYRTDLSRGTWTASDGFCQIFHFAPGGVYTMEEFQQLVHPDDVASVMAEFGACLAERRDFDVEYRCVVGPEQRVIHVRSTSHIVYDAAGNPIRVIGIKQDITEQVKLREQLVALQRLDAIGRVAGGVAHDFNNVLTAILGFAEMVQMRLPAADRNRPAIAQIIQSAEVAARLTEQLLAFSRSQPVAPRVLDLGAVARASEPILRRLIGGDVALVVDPDPDLWRVRVDQTAAEQVLMNLVVNARDAMPGGGRVRVEVGNRALEALSCLTFGVELPPGDYVCLSVTDTGEGMDLETQRQIFEPFFTTKPLGQGTGLGLATCFGLVEQAGGRIVVYSEVGAGSTFRVFLPRTDAAGERVASRPPETPAGGIERVLVAEDDAAVRELVWSVLSDAGYSVTVATDGRDALRHFEAEAGAFDLLLSDVMMPEMGGLGLVAALHATRPGLPVLLISGFPASAIADSDPASDALELLQKPFTSAQLLSRVRGLLDRATPR